MKYARRIAGLILVASAYWVLRGRFEAMQFEVNAGNSWGGVLSDIEYLIPGIGALLAMMGGIQALGGASGRWLAAGGALLVLLFMGLVGGISGSLDMVQPFLVPGLLVFASVAAIFVLKRE